jgi:hypothetical protein
MLCYCIENPLNISLKCIQRSNSFSSKSLFSVFSRENENSAGIKEKFVNQNAHEAGRAGSACVSACRRLKKQVQQ